MDTWQIVMADVNFYVIKTQMTQAELACRICRKSISTGQTPVLVKFEQQAELEHFDSLLWQFDASSFVPHDVVENAIDHAASPICLSLHIPEQFQGICINLGQHAIDSTRFSRVIEIIENNTEARAAGRLRFKAYREQGIEPVTHQM